MRAEDLDERDLERRDLAVHEDAGQVELHLETDVDVGAIDGRRPPERESTVSASAKFEDKQKIRYKQHRNGATRTLSMYSAYTPLHLP